MTYVAALTLLATGCSSLPFVGAPRVERWAFTAPWDARSVASAVAHAASLDAAVIGWIPLDSTTGQPFTLYPDVSIADGPGPARRMAMVTSFSGNRFQPEMLRRLAVDSVALARSAEEVVRRMNRGAYTGAVLDFEGMTPADTALTRNVVAAMASALHRASLGPVVVALPATDTAAYPSRLFTGSADLLLVMLYDEHWATSPPGPIASTEWARRALAVRVAEGGASRLVAALPLYGYRWAPNAVGTAITHDDARRLAAEAGVALERDPSSLNLHAVRAGPDAFELWLSDATLVSALEREATSLGVRRLAWWRLGGEDAGVWTPVNREP